MAPAMALSRRSPAWLAVLLWAAVIFALSSVPSLGTDLGVWDTILRKGAHTAEYAILAVLLMRALGQEVPSFLLGLAYAATDELHQYFVRGRHASPFDVAIDAVGLALGLLVLHATRSWTPSRST
jgi:VanZ family protein